MQVLVYTFMALSALGVGCIAYFALTFTPAEAIMAGLTFAAVAVVLLERTLRQRAENRLERAIEDLSRLLATDAQAGATLGQRINALADQNAGIRLEGMEADISVLGTVIRQVAEAVAEIEERASKPQTIATHNQMISPPASAAPPPRETEPVIPLETLRQAISDNRLLFHVQPVVTLPQRRPHGYDLVPRLMLDDGELADRAAFMPRKGGVDTVRHIDAIGMAEAITIARRSRSAGQPINLFVPLSRATLGDAAATDQILGMLEANRAIAPSLLFLVAEAQWQALSSTERAATAQLVKKGVSFSLDGVRSLRVDVAELAGQGVRSLRVDTAHFIADPQAFTDFHPSDIANYLNRFGIDLLATGVTNEHQILELLDLGIALIQGPHIAAPGPARPDLMLDRPKPATPALRRAERR